MADVRSRLAVAVVAALVSLTAVAGCGGSGGPAEVDVHSGRLGRYLTDSSGRALYLFDADRNGHPRCSGPCLTLWPPLTTDGTPKAGPGVSQSLLGTVRGTDGSTQVTYAGHPLYYFAKDLSPGQIAGEGNQGFGSPWWLASPSGNPIDNG